MITYKKKDLSKLHNIGDLLCTPDNYFNIVSDKKITIVGGGVWDIEKLSSESAAQTTILWAAGKSVKYPNSAPKIGPLRFLDWSIRDIQDLNDPSRFLPCVSCMNTEIISESTGNKTLVFTNANIQVSSNITKQDENKLYLTNSCSKEDFLSAWVQCDKIITNSYHGIYWGLLSGRQVIPFGYSSKFTNVTAMFGIVFPQNQLYPLSGKNQLSSLICAHKTTIQLTNASDWAQRFQELNLQFAERLTKSGVSCKII